MEIWKPIEGYEGLYQVSNLGRIKSFWFGKEKILSPGILKHGHCQIQLCSKGILVRNQVHRLVAIHFIHNPLNLPCVLHKKEDLDENGALYNGEDNLFWGTQKDNMRDMVKKGRDNKFFKYKNPNKGKFGKEHQCSKAINQYTKSGIFIRDWESITCISIELGIDISYISACCRRRRKTSGGFIWKYK